jgi:HMG (high mobility group) box
MSRIQSINAFVTSFISDASDILSPEQVTQLLAKWKKHTPELKKELKPKTAEQKAELAEAKEAKPKHFKSAYIFYCQQQRPIIKKNKPDASATDIISLLAQQWKALTATRKAPFETKAKDDKARYDREMTVYYDEHPDEMPKSKKPKAVSTKPKNAYQFFYEEAKETLKAEGLSGKNLQSAIFAKWREVKANKEELKKYDDMVSAQNGSEAEVTSDEVQEPVQVEEKADKTDKRYASAKDKIKEVMIFLQDANDEVTMNMIKAEIKNRKYRINKDLVKKIVQELIDEDSE